MWKASTTVTTPQGSTMYANNLERQMPSISVVRIGILLRSIVRLLRVWLCGVVVSFYMIAGNLLQKMREGFGWLRFGAFPFLRMDFFGSSVVSVGEIPA